MEEFKSSQYQLIFFQNNNTGTEQKVVQVLFFAIHQQAPFIICPIC